ncbi:MAG TPA: 2Fe-2S iron-sulfur cluster-binding protein, partial [Acidimicrobiales bacterium]
MTDTSPDASAVTVTLDGAPIEARKGELVIEAAERNGVYIPRFCYHPRMKPVGMCRMCIVEIDTGRGPALQPSCMIECADGMSVATESDATRKAQEGVLEFLLANHPLDCPVCDKGGECPLQDQTMSYGPGESRFVEEKRHFEKPIPVSDLVLLDRERCILCDRCTRFAKDVAGDPLIHFLDRANETQVNTFPGDPFASYFSGNTVQICPVGALTATPYRFKARPWDLEQTESTCTSCSVGCRVVVQSSRNKVLRYQGVDVDPVNWGWLCDKGRFDFEAVNSEERLGSPLVRDEGLLLKPAAWNDAVDRAAAAVREGLDRTGPDGLAVIGGARLTNEDAYAWTKLIKGVVGSDNVDAQLGDGLPADVVLGLPRATIDDACRPGGTVLLVGPDVKEELPVFFLRLRDAVLDRDVAVVELAATDTGMTDLARVSMRHRPGEELQLVRAMVRGGDASGDTGTGAHATAATDGDRAVAGVPA